MLSQLFAFKRCKDSNFLSFGQILFPYFAFVGGKQPTFSIFPRITWAKGRLWFCTCSFVILVANIT